MFPFPFFLLSLFGVTTTVSVCRLISDIFLDDTSVANQLHIKYPDALKLLIKKKKRNAINVGIFKDETNEIVPSLEITSEKGVSDNLYVGQVIYL